MTVHAINTRIARTHPKVGLVRGEGYLYFVYDDGGPGYESESVMVPYLKHHTMAEWVEMGKAFGDRMTEKMAARGMFGESLPPSGGPFAPFGVRL